MGTLSIAPAEAIVIVPEGTGVGAPAYFVVDPGERPWLAYSIHELLAEVTSASVVYLASPGGDVSRVHLRSDDAAVEWTVTLAATGDVIERVVYTDNPRNEWEYSEHATRVHGFPEEQ